MAISLREVASAAGVSLATASLAMSGRGKLAAQTRHKVKDTARQLGFRPNASARTLASGRSNMLGVAVRDPHYLALSYFGLILSGMAEVGDAKGVGLGFARTMAAGGDDNEPEYIRWAHEGRFDGMVVIDQAVKVSELGELSQLEVPVVLIDQQVPEMRIPSVRMDYRCMCRDATRELVRLGHRRIAVIGIGEGLFSYTEMVEGYKEALQEGDIGFDDKLVMFNKNIPVLHVVDWAKVNIGRSEGMAEPPTAYLSLHDAHTMVLCEMLRYLGLRIPEDVSVAGFTCNDGRQHFQPVGNVAIPAYELGVRASELMFGLLSGRVATRDVVLSGIVDFSHGCGRPGR